MNRAIENKLSLTVLEEHKTNLLTPPWKVFEKGTESLRQYVTDDVLDGFEIADHEKRWEAIQWQLNKNEKKFTKVNFLNQKDFCHNIGFDGLSELFNHPALKEVTDIDLCKCEISSLPDWSVLSKLRCADISGNNLEMVPASKSIQKLDVCENPIRALNLDREYFPNLSDVKAGSEFLNYISFDMLRRKCVTIVEE